MSGVFKAIVKNIQKISKDKVILSLQIDGFSYKAGQYLEAAFGENPPRPYSIASAPGKALLEIHIRDTGRGGASTYAVSALKAGEVVEIKGPFGACVWEPAIDKPLLLIAGGIGIAPLKAIAEAALANSSQTVVLYWGVRNEADLYIGSELEKLAKRYRRRMKFRPVILDPVGPLAVKESMGLQKKEIYLAGPREMISETIGLLLQKGAERSAIHTDDPSHHYVHHQTGRKAGVS